MKKVTIKCSASEDGELVYRVPGYGPDASEQEAYYTEQERDAKQRAYHTHGNVKIKFRSVHNF